MENENILAAGQQDKSPLTMTCRPCLARKARLQIDKVSGDPILLYPEGILLLNPTGAAIVKLCDGTHTFTEIVTKLAADYHIPAAALQVEVDQYIQKLHMHSLVELNLEKI